MPYDYTREALYHPERKPAFQGLSPGLAFDPTVTGFSVRNCWWLSNASHLAYYDEEPLRIELSKAGLELVRFFEKEGTQGFLAKSAAYAILAFRGTEPDDYQDIRQILNLPPVPFDTAGSVHAGFKKALELVWTDVERELQELGNTPVWYTGHSLGAALATLAAVRRAPVALFTFGSPRVGDTGFRDAVSYLNIYRTVNCADVVTTLPPRSFGYHHVGSLYFLTETSPLAKNPSQFVTSVAKLTAIAAFAAKLPWLRKNWVTARSLVDHAILNYTAGLWKEWTRLAFR